MKIPAKQFPDAVALRRKNTGRAPYTTPRSGTVLDAAHVEGGGIMVAYTDSSGIRWSHLYEDDEIIVVCPLDPVLDAVREARHAIDARENVSERNKLFMLGLLGDIYQAYRISQ